MPPSAGLIALELDHAAPVLAGPRHTRHVPTSRLVGKAGSSSMGVSIWLLSAFTCVAPMVAGGRKLAAAQLLPSGHASSFTPTPMVAYQFAGVTASMAGKPPS